MISILLLLQNLANRRLLETLLRDRYALHAIAGEETWPETVDLVLVDWRSLREHRETIEAMRRAVEPVLLPVLLLLPPASPVPWGRYLDAVDEVLMMPVQQQELLLRLAILGRARNWSLRLQDAVSSAQQLERQLMAANRELQHLALTDALTGVANRRHFNETLEGEWERAARYGLPLSVALCDVDFFKNYNDTYGHVEGDRCLQQVAGAIAASAARPTDLAARYGGEEFAVILPMTPLAGAVQVAQAIGARLAQLAMVHRTSAVADWVTASIGVAGGIPTFQWTPAQLVNLADRALYQAKLGGRNRTVSIAMTPESMVLDPLPERLPRETLGAIAPVQAALTGARDRDRAAQD